MFEGIKLLFKNMIWLETMAQTPKDVGTLLWILLGGSASIIVYLFSRWEKSKTDCVENIENVRKEERERYDKLQLDFSNYKDKTIEEKIEASEKFLVVLTNFQKELSELPEKVVTRSVNSCANNMEKYIDKLKNERRG